MNFPSLLPRTVSTPIGLRFAEMKWNAHDGQAPHMYNNIMGSSRMNLTRFVIVARGGKKGNKIYRYLDRSPAIEIGVDYHFGYFLGTAGKKSHHQTLLRICSIVSYSEWLHFSS